jgi:hypothetical protein
LEISRSQLNLAVTTMRGTDCDVDMLIHQAGTALY